MKTIRFISFFIILTQIAYSQWEWQSPIPQGNTLLSAQFTDTSRGWAVGEYGTIIHTSTGGRSWNSQEFGRTDDILSLMMISAVEGWAVGDNGTILHTTDGGDNWTEQASPVGGGLNSIFFLDQLNGWAAGDREAILRTTNGGSNWTIQREAIGTSSINSILFLNPSEGWAAGSKGRIYHTTDGGSIWTVQTVGSMSSVYQQILFVDASLGFVVGSEGMVLRTENGGTSWSAVGTGESTNYNRICMANTLVGWIAGDGGRVMRTVNGGLSWSGSSVGAGENLNGLSRAGNFLWAVGEYGKIQKSVNNGISWTALDSGTRLSINWINLTSGNAGAAVGQSGLLLRTTDGGDSWQQLSSPTPALSSFGVYMIDGTHGCAVGEEGNILKTSDGTTWLKQSSPTAHTLFGITFADQSNGWIVGGDPVNYTGIILKTTNGGSDWSIQNSSMPHMVYGADFVSPTTGWVVGDFGIIYKTTDGGSNWNPQSSGIGTVLYWCDFADQNNGWAIGDSGRIIHTTNGGTSWERQNSGTDFILFSLVQNGPMEAIAVGDSGTILQTTDAGLNWTKVYGRTPHPLYSVSRNGKFIAAGDFGSLLELSGPEALGTVTGTVFFDLNHNGLRDPDEGGLPGWEISLTGAQSQQAVTDGNGGFTFSSLPMGSYSVTQALKPDWTNTLPSSPSGYSFSLTILSPEYSCGFGNYALSYIPVEINQGWNIISLPLNVADPTFSTLYPNVISAAYYFDNAYKSSDTLLPGTGYWAKFPFALTNYITGSSIAGDTVEIKSGWNIIGPVSEPVNIGSIIASPAEIVLSYFFGYDAGYFRSDTLTPGHGYWVKSSLPGTLIIGAASAAKEQSRESLNSLHSLTISDGDGSSQTLYFGKGIDLGDRHLYEMPPPPPGEAFDARFNGSSQVFIFDGGAKNEKGTVTLQSYRPPLKIEWSFSGTQNGTFELSDETSGNRIASLSSLSGSVVLNSAGLERLSLASGAGMNGADAGLPEKYSLGQNYPNPFNPSTSIDFQLPEDGWVTMKLYDLVGGEVAVLANSRMKAGSHTLQFDAGGLPTGVYYYRMTAGNNFVDLKKMIIIK